MKNREYLRNAGELPTGEVRESQVVEACWNRRVVLNERLSHGISGKLLVDNCIMAQ